MDYSEFENLPRREKLNKRGHRSVVQENEDDYSPAKKRNVRRPDTGEFRCRNCRHLIGVPDSGTRQRNHCPHCLHSVHLDNNPGDRASSCKSIMDPITIWVRNGEWVLLHRCRGCGQIKANRVAPDDNEVLLVSIAMRPIGQPAFPLYSTEE
ncbi:MAG: RNHCP domain-containing protein [Leptospiraceae bacterium]|nr:RNHCP domain-containing protein [Leptospiraceae bacterium]